MHVLLAATLNQVIITAMEDNAPKLQVFRVCQSGMWDRHHKFNPGPFMDAMVFPTPLVSEHFPLKLTLPVYVEIENVRLPSVEMGRMLTASGTVVGKISDLSQRDQLLLSRELLTGCVIIYPLPLLGPERLKLQCRLAMAATKGRLRIPFRISVK